MLCGGIAQLGSVWWQGPSRGCMYHKEKKIVSPRPLLSWYDMSVGKVVPNCAILYDTKTVL